GGSGPDCKKKGRESPSRWHIVPLIAAAIVATLCSAQVSPRQYDSAFIVSTNLQTPAVINTSSGLNVSERESFISLPRVSFRQLYFSRRAKGRAAWDIAQRGL